MPELCGCTVTLLYVAFFLNEINWLFVCTLYFFGASVHLDAEPFGSFLIFLPESCELPPRF